MHHLYSTPIFIGNLVVGKVEGDVFLKSIRGSRHILRKPPAIAFDVSTLNQAEQAGAVIVQVVDQETGITYRAQIAHIKDVGIRIDRGYGEQIALPLEGWTMQKRGDGLQYHLWR